MKSEETIKAYVADRKVFHKRQSTLLLIAITFELSHLEEGEVVKLDSHLGEGLCIPTFEYTDHVNLIHKDGTCPTWNNVDCEGPHVDTKVKVNETWNLDTLSEILSCCVAHNKEKRMNDADFKNLNTLSEHLDPSSDLRGSLDKAIKTLNKI